MGKSLPSHPSSLKLTLWDSGPVNRHVKMAMLPLQLCSLIVQANEQVICGGRHNHTVAAMLSRSMNTDVIRATFFANSDKDEDLRMKMFGSRYDVYDRFEPPKPSGFNRICCATQNQLAADVCDSMSTAQKCCARCQTTELDLGQKYLFQSTDESDEQTSTGSKPL